MKKPLNLVIALLLPAALCLQASAQSEILMPVEETAAPAEPAPEPAAKQQAPKKKAVKKKTAKKKKKAKTAEPVSEYKFTSAEPSQPYTFNRAADPIIKAPEEKKKKKKKTAGKKDAAGKGSKQSAPREKSKGVEQPPQEPAQDGEVE
jgi:hypothetical protein